MRISRNTYGRLAAALAGALAFAPATQLAHAQTFKVLYTFSGYSDGAHPEGTLLLRGGNLYGTTRGGQGGVSSCGTVFQVNTKTNQETTLYTFAFSPSDGCGVYAGLTGSTSGEFCGTTANGGASNDGTVFQVSSLGAESLLHSFAGPQQDGQRPVAALIRDSAGNLYGTTEGGGTTGSGTVFKLDTVGNLTILHSFRSTPDGAGPMASLLLEHGILYGTTFGGGKTNGGTVFKVNVKTGRETVLYNFTGGADGDSPYAGVITDGNGNLYGTTGGGGIGAGVVYKLNIAARQETVLYSFTGGVDGLAPTSALVRDSQGNLYGTTSSGGAGTVFKLDTAGNLTTLHTFSGSDGANPYAGLVRDSKGNLYGAAFYGGSAGFGTIFEITP